MDASSRFTALARQGLPFYEYAGEFCKLNAATAWDDATLNKLFWLGANHHRPVDLPDTTGLSWREGVFRCLASVRARARTSPPLFAAPASPPPFAPHASPPPSAALPLPHTPPFAAKAGLPAVSMASPPAVSMASPPAVPVASLPVAAPFRPVPAPRQRPPEPAPRQRPPEPAPQQCPPVPAPWMRLAVPAPPERPQVPDRAPTFPKEILRGGGL